MSSSSILSRGDEQRPDEHADDGDGVARGIRRGAGDHLPGQQVRREPVESVKGHHEAEEGRRDEKRPSDLLERVGQQQDFVHDM